MHEQLRIQKILTEHYLEARKKNPAYSLRSFAKRLSISSSTLSEVFNGKRQVSKKLAEKLLLALNVPQQEMIETLSLFQPRRHVLSKLMMKAPHWKLLQSDEYKLLSDWHHFAILSLLETQGSHDNPAWIAKRLSIDEQVANKALQLLTKLELLQINKNTGRLTPTGAQYSTTDQIVSLALRKTHAQNLALAKDSLEKDSIDERDFSAVTMAIDPEKLPQAKRMIREFRDRLCSYLETGSKKEVYKLCTQLIPLSREVKK